jgi:hypothetical protein
MRDFDDSTLWRISAFERMRRETGTTGFNRLEGPTLLPTTLLADLQRLEFDGTDGDALEVVAACMRHREPALIYLQNGELVWPVTLFPREGVYHSPRDVLQAPAAGLAQLKVLATEPPGVRAPGHWMHERIGQTEHYRALAPLLWQFALQGPRRALLSEIDGTAAYRVVFASRAEQLMAPGALGPAVERLRLAARDRRLAGHEPGARKPTAQCTVSGIEPDGHAQPPVGPPRPGGGPLRLAQDPTLSTARRPRPVQDATPLASA